MRSARFLVTRVLPACILLIGAGSLVTACSSSSSSKTTPTIQYETPTPGPSATPTTAAPSASASASGSPAGSATGGSNSAVGTNVELTAKDIKFDKSRIVVPAGKKITLKMTNDDSIPHNFAAYDKKGGTAFYTGPIFGGPNVTKTDTFTAPSKPGDYYFQCDVHPSQMNGTLVVQ